MGDHGLLSDELLRQLMAMGEVDILVGLATYNNASTVDEVMRTTQTAFARFFHRDRTALIIADAGSRDGTLQAVRAADARDSSPVLAAYSLRTMHQIAVPYHGVPGKANALRTIFAAAELSRARVCVLVGADHEGMNPEGIEHLVRPVYREGFDFVSPLYQRHKFEGLLLKNLLYPVTRAIYGLRIREPLGGANAFSARLVAHFYGEKLWESEASRYGIDLALTAAAAVGGFRVCEAVVGAPSQASRGERVGLGSVVEQVVGSLFACLELHERSWQTPRTSTEAPVMGTERGPAVERVRVNRKRMLDRFRNGVSDLGSVLEQILAVETLGEIRALAGGSDLGLRFPDELWAKTVYDFASAYHRSVMHRGHLLQALTPLYLGRAASFVIEHLESGAAQVDRRLEELCLAFERLKPYLVERWNGG